RSMPVRNLGVPLQRDIGVMAWGEPKNRLFYYSIGVYNGDGPNRLNADNRFDVSGRALVRPFATRGHGPIKDLHVGVSARGGSRDPRLVGYDVPAMTSQEGYAFWRPTYKDSTGRLVHIMPSTQQGAFGADLFAPIGPIDAIGEFIWSTTNTREAADGYQLTGQNLRAGDLTGFGWYGQIGVWVIGDRSVIGFPSYGKPTHVDLDQPPPNRPIQALELLGKFEELRVEYGGATRAGTSDAKTPNGGVNVDDVEFGATYWATKHVRVSANYTLYVFSDRALWPGTALPAKVDDSAKAQGHTLNEISTRVGVQF
ncbi:MAG: porin, partial [Polyangiaceae bacterium]